MSIFTTKTTKRLLLFVIGVLAGSLSGFGQTITGTVFRDFNTDGIYTSIPGSGTYAYGEPGVGGVTVKAFNAAGVTVATTTSSTLAASLGSYTLSVGNTNAYRVEFTNLIADDYEAFRGTNSATSVQFVNGGATNVNLGINYPQNYCQTTNPTVYETCFVQNQPPVNGGFTDDVIVSFPYSATGQAGSPTTPKDWAKSGQVGSVWGLAYDRTQKKLYSSAFLKRYVGFGPAGIGAIYTTDITSASSNGTTFVDLDALGFDTGTDPHGALPTDPATPTHDANSFLQVGKMGLGGLTISDDDQYIYTVNLFDRKLYRIPTVSPTAGNITSWSIASPCSNALDFRPFGVKYYRGKVYVGVVCTSESNSSTATLGTSGNTQLTGTVYEFDGTTFTSVLSFGLSNFKRGAVGNESNVGNYGDRWYPWLSNSNKSSWLAATNNQYAFPQPILSDIDFDVNGDMIVGIMDRFGHQMGYKNYPPASGDNSLVTAWANGDQLRARRCSTGNQFTLESNAALCGVLSVSTAAQNGQGPGGGEFYYQDDALGGFHEESSNGGIALLPGTNELAVSAMDPINNAFAGGIRWYNNTKGTFNRGFELYGASSVGTFGKASGTGDLAFLCNPAPIEIGNRVWLDTNDNGIQDPGETPLAGITVNLKGPGLPGAGVNVVTNSNGEYYFSNGTGTAAMGFVYSLTGLTSGGSYSLTFPTSVTTGNAYLSSKPNSATGTNSDNIDTDPNAAGLVSFTLGQAGQNNFSYDAGYVPCTPPSLTAIASSNSVCQGTPVTVSVQVSPAGSYTYAWSAPAGVTLTGANTATATTSGLPSGTNTFTVTVSTSPVCSTTATVSVVVNPAPIASLSALQTTICAGQSTTLTAGGGTTYRFSTTGIISATTTAVVSPTATTTYSVTVISASGCSTTATATVTVNLLPTPGLTSATICAGQTAALTATGGSSYTFSNGTANTTGLLTFTPTSSTVISVTVANASGCVSTTSAGVTVNPAPSLTVTSASICAGQTATLTASGANSYTWSTGATTASISVSVAGPYSVTGTSAAGCSATASASLTVNLNPAVGITSIVCIGLTNFTVSFTATTGASLSVNTGTLIGNTVTGVPTGQNLFITASLNSCTATTGPISQNCQANAASLGDYVFVDANKNGIQDGGDTPIPGVTVVLLDGSNTPIRSTTTNSSGLYSFTGLTPGVPYSVSFVTPAGYTSTSAQIGGDDTKDSDASPITGQTRSVTLAPAENNPNLDAGFFLIPPKLTIDKLVNKSKAKVGDVMTYTLVLTNVGSVSATNVVVRDSATTGLRYVAGSATAPAGTTFSPGAPISTWTVATIAPAQSLSITFQAIADSSGILYNTATIPGDTAQVCTSVPVKVCPNSEYTFRLTAPAGRSSYRWFRDGVELLTQTSNVLDVTQPGSYSLAVDNVTGKCPDFSCCPFIVEEDTLPTVKATAIPVTCIGTTPQTNGQIILSQVNPAYTYQYSLGATFNAGASLSGAAKPVPVGGVIASNLANPVAATAYTVRVYNSSGCFTDVTVMLQPTLCSCPPQVCTPFVIQQTKKGKRIGG